MNIRKPFSSGLISWIALVILITTTNPNFAQGTIDPLLERLRAIQDNENASAVELKSATIIVDRILKDFPASNAAVSILLEETLEGLDFTSFAKRLDATLNAPPEQPSTTLQEVVPSGQTQPSFDSAGHLACLTEGFTAKVGVAMQLQVSVDAGGALLGLPVPLASDLSTTELRQTYLGMALAIETCAPYADWPKPATHLLNVSETGTISIPSLPAPQTPPEALSTFDTTTFTAPPDLPNFDISSAETEADLNLARLTVRDVQARLLVLGFDPNGVDGSMGRGTRSAISSWQASIGVEPSGFLNQYLLGKLNEQSQEQLSAWLQDPKNQALLNPPKKKLKKKRRVRVCKRNAIGILYDCKIRWR